MPPKVRIRRFAVLKTASVFALMYIVLIAIIAIPILLILVPATVMTADRGGESTTTILAGGIVFALLAMVFYGIFAWIFGAIFCLAYNLVARWIGGIEVEVERFGDGGPGMAYGYPGYPQGWPAAAPGQPPGYELPRDQAGTQQPWAPSPSSDPGQPSPPAWEPPTPPVERPEDRQPPR